MNLKKKYFKTIYKKIILFHFFIIFYFYEIYLNA